MKKISFSFAFFATCAQLLSSANAAPLDALLTAHQESIPSKGHIEASYDVTNDKVDVFNIRANDSATSVGDYRGGHIQGGIAITPRIWIDGAFWQRKIESRSFQAKVNTWQAAGQYKLLDGAGYVPDVAVRLGMWGNYADEFRREKNVQVNNVTLKSTGVTDPKDEQYQIDLIGTWPVSKRTEVTSFVSAGTSRIDIGSAYATTTIGDCLYTLTFGPTHVVGVCDTPAMSTRFSTPNSVYGIDVNQEVKYKATYYQAGLMTKWSNENWQLRAGYQYQLIKRDQVDDIIESRGETAYKKNHILVADVTYQVFRNAAIFLRGEYMSNQFNGVIPMAYNSFTASRFDQRYGVVSGGLLFRF
jgi:hypothetical protein